MKYLLTILLLMISCGKKEDNKEPVLEQEHVNALSVKYNFYVNEIYKVQGDYGFIEDTHCDSVMFSGLTGIAVSNITLIAARNENGQWFRRPSMDCYPENSQSTISRDMFIGIMWYLWKNKDLNSLERIWEYGENTNWKMGEGAISRVFFTPNMISTLAILIDKLGGYNHSLSINTPLAMGKQEGFQAHLDVLLLLLRAEALGYIEKPNVVDYQYQRNPQNSLFAYAYNKYISGNHYTTVLTLLNEQYFPSNRLPTRGDRKAPWLWERDVGADWAPSDENPTKSHSGGDFLFVTKLLFDDLNK